MKYTVSWTDEASEALAELWLSAPARDEVTKSATTIERELRTNPLEVGESRTKQLRILIVSPLAVFYEVHELDRLVVVSAIWSAN